MTTLSRRIRPSGALLVLVLALVSWAERAAADPILPRLAFGCVVDCSTVNQGDTFDLVVRIEDITDLFTFSFGLAYDPSVVRINAPSDIRYGDFLGTNPAGLYATVPCDQDPNLTCAPPLLFGGTVQGNPVSGSGVLARIQFDAFGVGDSGLAFVFNVCDPSDTACQTFNPLFFDSLGGLLDVDRVNGTVVVQSTVPEPATIGLLGLGLLGLARRRFRVPRA